MVKKTKVVFQLVFFVFLIGFVSALDANFSISGNTNGFINLKENNTFNFSVGAMSENITSVRITYTTSTTGTETYIYLNGSNGTSATNFLFNDSSNYSGSVSINYALLFANSTSAGVVPNGTVRNFWITITAPRSVQSAPNIVVNTTGISGTSNVTSYQLFSAFAFSGYVLNETGCSTCWQNATNVTIYGVTNSPGMGPPVNTNLGSTLTNESGYFRLAQINNSGSFNGFKLKMIYYNSSGTATKVGTIMPEFPSFMYYGGGSGGSGEFDMSLNGATFYLQPAATINIWGTNGTTQVSFGYEVIDQALGFPVESNVLTKTTNATIILPSGRNYVVSQFRMFGYPGANFGYIMTNQTLCGTTDFMNDTECPSPPKSMAINGINSSQIFLVNQSLIVRKAFVHGCINPAPGANNSAINISSVSIKMLPWSSSSGSFIPPRSGDDGNLNLSSQSQFNTTYSGCLAYYNLTLMNNTGYFLEFYAKNASHGNESANPGSANNLAGFQNLTALNSMQQNITLYKLAGNYVTTNVSGLSVNTSAMKINLVNSSGGAITTSVSANAKIKNNNAGIGIVYYMIDSQTITNGTFYIPVLNNSNYAKIMIFSNNGPPKEKTINLSASEINVTIVSMDGRDKGFRKFNSNGSLEVINSTSTPIKLRFLRNVAGCDVPNLPDDSSCVLTSMNASGFNPLKALLAGKVNMEIKITSTNVSLMFLDYDMMSAKQPPMESIMEENASGRGTTSGSTAVRDQWNFGSFAPSDSYANVTITIPYSDSSSASNYLNDSASVNISVGVLYDENNRVMWNSSRGDTPINLSDDLIEYNNTFYRNLTLGGVNCTSSISNTCFINTSGNYMSMKIPHFSTIGAVVSGSATLTSTATTTTTTNSPGGSSSTTAVGFWTNTYTYDVKELRQSAPYVKELKRGQRVRLKVNNEVHHVGVISTTSTMVIVNISSTPQQASINTGQEKKFNINDDSYYDLSIRLNGVVNSSANLTITGIYEEIVRQTNNTASVGGNNTGAVGNATGGNEGGAGSDSGRGFWIAIVVIIVVLILVGVVVVFVVFSRKENKKHWQAPKFY